MNKMPNYEMHIKDEQWQKLEPLLIGKQGDPGASAKNNRLFIEAVLWVVLRKAAWRSLPFQFGKTSAAYMRFRRWNECDFWRALAENEDVDCESRRLLEQIARYGYAYTERLKQRKARRDNKAVYTTMMNAVINKAPARQTLKSIEESTSHWVALVASQ